MPDCPREFAQSVAEAYGVDLATGVILEMTAIKASVITFVCCLLSACLLATAYNWQAVSEFLNLTPAALDSSSLSSSSSSLVDKVVATPSAESVTLANDALTAARKPIDTSSVLSKVATAISILLTVALLVAAIYVIKVRFDFDQQLMNENRADRAETLRQNALITYQNEWTKFRNGKLAGLVSGITMGIFALQLVALAMDKSTSYDFRTVFGFPNPFSLKTLTGNLVFVLISFASGFGFVTFFATLLFVLAAGFLSLLIKGVGLRESQRGIFAKTTTQMVLSITGSVVLCLACIAVIAVNAYITWPQMHHVPMID